MQVHNPSGQDVLDLFDHENEIDFETAYQMLSGTLEELDNRPLSPYKELRHPEMHTPGTTFANPMPNPTTPNLLTVIPTGMTPTLQQQYPNGIAHNNNNNNNYNAFNNIRFSPESQSQARFPFDDIPNSKSIDAKMTPLGHDLLHFPNNTSKVSSPNFEYPDIHGGSHFLLRSPGMSQTGIMTNQDIMKMAPKNDFVHKMISEDHFRNAELLSTYESHAIESFLDNLISTNPLNDDKEEPNTAEPIKLQVPDITKESKQETDHEQLLMNKVEHEPIKNITLPETPSTTIDNYEIKYRPKRVFKPVRGYPCNSVEIPGITISDDDIPADIKGDLAKVRKWKHVQLEKIRRTQSKNAFEDLIKLIDASELKAEKRVPKYKLLNCVMDDIQELMKANEQLESMLET
ncbi:hypothetical protein RNJ44_04988 [Nakaseomyces bracarensis]|uniref:BHLH domain-containing protein n=1 Tax=Nakaseomyces bracarensis TaxID=273131 RepID=A0ABR4NWT7_9SACH